MNSWQLFLQRLKQNMKHQFGIIKSVIDWTVLVYLVIPTVVIFIAIYRSWWYDLPSWIENVPFSLIFIFFFLFLWGGHFNTYVKEADNIFLRKNELLLLGLKQKGILFSYVFELWNISYTLLLMAPFWFMHYHRSIGDMLFFATMCVSLKWLIMAIKGKLNIEVRGWRSFIEGIPLFIGAIVIWHLCYRMFMEANYLMMIIIIALHIILSMLLVRSRFTTLRTLEQDLAIAQLERHKYLNMIFELSLDIEKMPKQGSFRKTPRLFSKSGRIFINRTPKNGFLELFIKVTTRSFEYISGYFQIVGVTSAAVFILPPLWLKISMIIAGSIFLIVWIGSVWHKVIGSHPFTRKYAREEAYFTGKKIVTTMLVIPFLLIISVSFGLNILVRQYLPFF